MCEYLNYEVTELRRVRIMNIKLDVAVGTYRLLSKQEMAELSELLKDSSKTVDGD
jgi:23S rRNA pseudouridine2604 synthase